MSMEQKDTKGTKKKAYMKASFELKIYNDVALQGMKCSLEGTVGNNCVTLCLKGEHSGVQIELSAAELVLAASRMASAQDGLMEWPGRGKRSDTVVQ